MAVLMRSFHLLVLLLSCSTLPAKAQLSGISDGIVAKPELETDTVITARLTRLVLMPPYCGIFAFATVQRFAIVSAPDFLKDRFIWLVIPCPELFGDGFFVKNSVYKLWLSRENQLPDAIIIQKNRKKKVTDWWVTKAEAFE